MSSVLFDLGSSFSYISTYFAVGLDMMCDTLDTPIFVSTPVGDSVVVDSVYPACAISFMRYSTWADLMILDMVDFDIIVGMSWLSLHYAILDFHSKTVTLSMPGAPRLE